ncbi:hypothetical protein NDU88_001390 [Pleurodeles waltl]|uniref:Uncharacterized protein n=1 Tax=Pleurodeles waltl TaxID=8319 RepID=A0AAV7MLK8_PLEWA|nr:hypothetical protein NDU88_001390 [Pleurodeles waltl]
MPVLGVGVAVIRQTALLNEAQLPAGPPVPDLGHVACRLMGALEIEGSPTIALSGGGEAEEAMTRCLFTSLRDDLQSVKRDLSVDFWEVRKDLDKRRERVGA